LIAWAAFFAALSDTQGREGNAPVTPRRIHFIGGPSLSVYKKEGTSSGSATGKVPVDDLTKRGV